MKPSAGVVRGGVVAAIVLVVLGAASATPWVVTLTLPSFGRRELPPQIPQITVQPQKPAQTDPQFAQTLANVGTVLLALAVAAVIVLALRWLARRLMDAWRPEDAVVEADALDSDVPGGTVTVDIASLATAVARAEAHLAGHAEPSDAVVAAWVALEDEAELQGSGRDRAQTATEFTSVLLEHTPAPPADVAVLRGLYHRARFTSHPVTGQDVRRARDALAAIARALDAEIVVGSGENR